MRIHDSVTSCFVEKANRMMAAVLSFAIIEVRYYFFTADNRRERGPAEKLRVSTALSFSLR
jgi:hypothetical protein